MHTVLAQVPLIFRELAATNATHTHTAWKWSSAVRQPRESAAWELGGWARRLPSQSQHQQRVNQGGVRTLWQVYGSGWDGCTSQALFSWPMEQVFHYALKIILCGFNAPSPAFLLCLDKVEWQTSPLGWGLGWAFKGQLPPSKRLEGIALI